MERKNIADRFGPRLSNFLSYRIVVFIKIHDFRHSWIFHGHIWTHLDTAGAGLNLPHVRNSAFDEFDGKLTFQCIPNGFQKLVCCDDKVWGHAGAVSCWPCLTLRWVSISQLNAVKHDCHLHPNLFKDFWFDHCTAFDSRDVEDLWPLAVSKPLPLILLLPHLLFLT